MAGGTWTSQNKVQPGVYINTKSQGNVKANIGTRGIVAIAEPLSWGALGIVQTIIPGEDLTPYIGYDITSEKALFLREMMKGSDTTAGPSKILLYRPKGSGGAKATATTGTLTATAVYEGVRGNDIAIVISADPDEETTFQVATVVDGSVRDEQTAKKAEDLTGNAWVTFSGSGELAATAGKTLTDGKDPSVSTADYAAWLTAMEPYKFDVLIYDGEDKTTIQAVAAFVKRVSNNVGLKCQAVMANAQASNSEWVISVNNGIKLDDGTVLDAKKATWWLGGAEAGALYNQSLTYSRYPDAIEASPKLTDTQIEAAIQAGEIVFIDTFDKVKVCTDINTHASFTVDKGEEYAKNRVMRVLNQFCNDVYEHFSNYFIGKVSNDETGRGLLKGWIVGYLNDMQANGGVQNFEAEDVTVGAGNSIDAVLIEVKIQPVDSIEKIYMSVTVSASTETE